MPAEELEVLSFTLDEVQSLNDWLWMMNLEQRRNLIGLPANRADVILFGIAIFEVIMVRCGANELRPTLRGVRHGALLG